MVTLNPVDFSYSWTNIILPQKERQQQQGADAVAQVRQALPEAQSASGQAAEQLPRPRHSGLQWPQRNLFFKQWGRHRGGRQRQGAGCHLWPQEGIGEGEQQDSRGPWDLSWEPWEEKV